MPSASLQSLMSGPRAGKHAPKRAEVLLSRMEELNVLPNTITFNAIINTWAKSQEKGAARRAESILDNMLKFQKSGRDDVRPGTTSFTAVIDVWAKSGNKGAYRHADRLFQQMQCMQREGYAGIEPNAYTYSAVINALAVSLISGKGPRAFATASQNGNESKERRI